MDPLSPLLAEATRAQREGAYLHFGGDAWTYRELLASLEGLIPAIRDRAAGASRPVVAAMVADPVALVRLVWACVAGGFTLVFLPLIRSRPRAEALAREVRASCLGSDVEEISGAADRLTIAAVEPTGPWDAACIPAFVFQSSGTTGEPKWVTVPHDHFGVAVDRLLERHRARYAGHLAYITPPLTHSYGLSAFFEYTLAGSAIRLPAAKSILGAVGELRGAHAASISALEGVPHFYAQLSRMIERVRLPALRACGVGGGPAGGADLDRLATAFPEVRFSLRYGMTETPSVVSFKLHEPGARGAWSSSGRVLPHYEVRIVGDDGLPAAHGEIQIKGACFSSAAAPPDGFHATGDIGYLDEAGELCVTGRKSAFLKRAGIRISPEYVEAAARALPGVEDCRASMAGEALLLEVVAGGIDPARAGPWAIGIRKDLGALLPEHALPDRVALVGAIPRTPSGKIMRRRSAPVESRGA